MAIKSKIKNVASRIVSGVKKTASDVKNVAKSVAGSINNAVSAKQPAAVFRATVGENLSPAATAKAYQAISKYTGGTIGGKAVSSFSPSQSPSPSTSLTTKPSSVKASSISSPNTSGYRSTSNYASPSYSANLGSTSTESDFSSPTSFKISSNTLGAGTPSMIMPSAPSVANYQGEAIGGNVSVGAAPDTGLIATPSVSPSTETPESTEESKAENDFNQMLKSLKAPVSQEKLYEKAERESGLREAQQRLANTQNEINAVTTKMNTDLLQLRGTAAREAVVEAVYGGQQAQVTREATIRLLPLQAQLAADQSNLELADERLNTLFSIYSKDAQNSVDFYNQNVKSVYEFMTAQEKKKADANSKQKDFEASLLKDEINNQQDEAMQALKDGNMALYRALTSLRPPTNVNSPTFTKDRENYLQDKANAIARFGKSTGSGAASATVQNYADLLAQGKITLANVPQNIRNEVVAYAGSNINKPLSDTAIKEVQQSQSAVANLKALKTTVEQNLQFVGPISGLAKLNPYSKARKVQAEIDRVRQQVGKTLEGGVLRKEDEEKYKKILATLSDTPETAIYKIDALISSIERDIDLYKNLQAETGRYVPGAGAASNPEELRAKYNY